MGLAENLEVLNLRAIAASTICKSGTSASPSCRCSSTTRRRAITPCIWIRRRAAPTRRCWSTPRTRRRRDRQVACNRDFRRALALGIDRDQLNEAFWLGIGTAGSTAPADGRGHQPGERVPEKVGALDGQAGQRAPRQARPDEERRRRLPVADDGKGRLRIELMTVGGQFIPYTRSPR